MHSPTPNTHTHQSLTANRRIQQANKRLSVGNLALLLLMSALTFCSIFCPIEDRMHQLLIGALIATAGGALFSQWDQHRKQQKESQDSLWFSTVVNNIADGILTVDTQGKILFASPAIATISGYSPEELVDQPLSILVPEHLLERHNITFTRIANARQSPNCSQRLEAMLKKKCGQIIFIELSYQESLFQGQRVFVGIVRDISKRRQMEEERRQLSLAVRNSPSGVMITNHLGEIEYANPKLLQMTGFTKEEVIGENPRIFSSKEKSREDYERMWQTLLNGDRWYDEFKNKRKDGSHYWVIASIAPMYDDHGSLTHFVSVQEDITSIKQANQAMSEAKEVAESALKARSEFLSNMNHELRTPLNAIIGFAQLLESDPDLPLSPEQNEYTEQIMQSGHHLLALINEVLDLAKAEAGQYQLTPINTNALSITKDSISMIKHLAEQNGIDLKLNTICEKLSPVLADPGKLKQVMINLLSNAIKYNRPDGKVTVIIEEIDTDSIRISVQDTGMGIPAELQGQVFQPFNRLNAEGSNIEGSGIGLALCKNLIELMNGGIGFISEEGQGSTFWIDLPRAEH